jgi:V/A-type H+-transporting ATPase subunit C
MADYLYAVGRIKVLENKLLDSGQWQRLSDADEQEGIKILEEAGYGADAERKGNLDAMIEAETSAVRMLIAELSPEPELSNLFLLPADAHNIKVIFKSILNRSEDTSLYLPGGSIPLELLKKCVETGDYEALPPAIGEAMEKAEGQSDPRLLSAIIDNGVYAHILQELSLHKNALLSRYFTSKIDFTNVLTIIRCNVLGWNAGKTLPLLIEGGDLPVSTLTGAVGMSEDQLPRQLGVGEDSSLIKGLLETYAQNRDYTILEQGFENALTDIIHEERSDSFGIGPMANYLLARLNEARALRILFTGKRAGIKVPLSELGIL